mgnify:CR=1 FL=1
MPLSLNIGVHSDESASVPHPMQNAKTRLTGGVMSDCPQHLPRAISIPFFSKTSYIGLVFDGLLGCFGAALRLFLVQFQCAAQACPLPFADSGT